MSGEMPSTVGVHVGDNTDRQAIVQAFDEAVKPCYSGPYKRSEALLHAMELRVIIEEQLARAGLQDLDEREKRATVRQALLDHLEADAG